MKNCGCHFCRAYGYCEEGKHDGFIWARYYGEGNYWWGGNAPKGGSRVKICVDCRDNAFEEEMTREEFEKYIEPTAQPSQTKEIK